ncbi:Nsr1p KNAG_0D03220 [Huiozyma naganishii CBS 8797]|uniref:RRM domain-containing protein n=1 Tax=Huiozyma naganishii (strain ATCC MYA-139 / BCRC 22969 / CBS 8797 / KCTC 17520 / NBRC 10181 / NCYC 3082 / Yp74L-3) TaxID=1071383 RepID=J7RKP0_HUIN7|nr:hypothetical protein KNAG_0D03220 [Kazachstania naganishii CBS 8797]CCK70068.1 hypothetical protein KNAG_0D03220 [Kazachstania naganishii CBS 8797]
MAKSSAAAVKSSKKAAASSKKAAASSSSDSSSSSSSSSSESSSSDSSSSESSSDEEVEETKAAESGSDSDSSSDESESDSDDKKKPAAKKDSSDSESDSDSESGSDSDSDSASASSSSSDSNDQERKASDDEEEEAEVETKKSKTQEPATLFVGRLSWSVDDEWLKNEFAPIGGVVSARVIMERGTDRSRGYGYVDFEDISYAEKALKEMQGKEIDGRPINVDMSTSKPAGGASNDRAKKFGDVPSEPSDTLFLGNLSFDADRDNLYEIFGKFGEIISVRIPTHPETEQPKGFGYVQYTNTEDAKKALDALQGESINDRPVRLDFSTPRPQNDRGGFRGGNRGGNGGGFRGGNRGGNRGGSFRGGSDRGGFRSGSGANNSPLGKARSSAPFQGQKKTFD